VPHGSSVNRWRYRFEAAPAYVDISPRQSLERYLCVTSRSSSARRTKTAGHCCSKWGRLPWPWARTGSSAGICYRAHVRKLARAAGLTATHRLIELAGVGHAARDILTAPQTREAMFGW